VFNICLLKDVLVLAVFGSSRASLHISYRIPLRYEQCFKYFLAEILQQGILLYFLKEAKILLLSFKGSSVGSGNTRTSDPST
jgi:hypothetical protein